MALDRLLTIGHDAKTVKGQKQGYLTGILYLAPWKSAGIRSHDVDGTGGRNSIVNVCPNASLECVALCLNTAGRGAFDSIQQGRLRKTRLLFADRQAFMATLRDNVKRLLRMAERQGFTPCVRLNGTSDIGWESEGFGIMQAFPAVQFYDYTKSAVRMWRYLDGRMPANYHLTFSRSECNDADALGVLSSGGNVAVVFTTRRGEPLPTTWCDYPVIDGDESDLRFLDGASTRPAHIGLVVGLRAKGRAKTHRGGFIVAAEPALPAN
jgi:hypothetical protein